MLKIGNIVINPSAIAYIDLEAKKRYVAQGEDDSTGVRIYLKIPENNGLSSLFFKGEEAEKLRKYFTFVAYKCDGLEDIQNL